MNSTQIYDNNLRESSDLNVSDVVVDCSASFPSRPLSWKSYREVKEKTRNLESIIQSLSSPIKSTVTRNLTDSVLSDVIVNADSNSVHEAIAVSNLTDHLRDLNQKRLFSKLHETMNSIFKGKMTDENFLKWLAVKLEVRPSRFCIQLANWRERNFREARGSKSMPVESKQKIYMWVENSISSNDARNGRNLINISKNKYNTMYRNIENKSV